MTAESLTDPATSAVVAFDSFDGHSLDPIRTDAGPGFFSVAADPFAGLERSELAAPDHLDGSMPASIRPHALAATAVTSPASDPRDLVATGTPAVGFATGDFNADGRPDLAVLSGATAHLALLSGVEAGGFVAAGGLAVGAGPKQVIAADLDGQGGLDLVVLSSTAPELAVFLNDGAGQFAARPPLVLGGTPVGMTVAELDGVPGVEIVVAHGQPGRLQVLFGLGGGNFRAAIDRSLPGQPAHVAVGDVTGDGRPDLLVALEDSQGGVTILDNRGDGSFAEPRTAAFGTAYRRVLAADTDRDGDVDLVAINTRGGVANLPNAGGGDFSQTSTSIAGQDLADLAVGDFNNDGWVDTLVIDRGGEGRLLWRLNPGTSGTNPAWTTIATVGGAESLTLADTDVDGDGDILYLQPATGKVGVVGLAVPGRASGTVYRDFNGNGQRDPGEPGLAGVPVYHDANANGQPDERIIERSSLSQVTIQGGRSESLFFSGIPAMTVRDLDVELTLDHQGSLGDVEVKLTGPGGVSVVLIPAGSGLSGTRLVGTVLDDDATQGLLAGADPWTGSFKPLGSLQAFDGLETTGTWTLEVRNAAAAGSFSPRLVFRSAKLLFKGPATVTLTDRDGGYSLPGLNPLSGGLRLLPDARFAVTSPAQGHHELNLRPGGVVAGLDFGVRSLLGRASGLVWQDRDGDGVADAGEPAVADRDVYADLNANGRLDGFGVVQSAPLTLATVNNSTVSTSLNVVGFPGKVVDVDLMLDVVHAEAGYDLTLVLWNPGRTFVNVVMNLFRSGQADFKGLVLDDEATRALATGQSPFDGSFRPSNSLSALDGKAAEGTWTLEIADRGFNQTGVLKGWGLRITTDQAEPVVRTGADGRYTLSDLPAGVVVVRQAPLPEGWTQTFPAAGAGHTFTAGVGTHAENLDFGDRVAGGTLTGRVWVDLDGDRKLEPPVEPLLADWRVFLDTVTVNGRLDAGEPSVLTDRDGRYAFSELPAGLYAVGVVVPDAKVVEPDWIQTSPESGVHQVELGPGRTLDDLDFAVLQLAEIRGQVFLFEPTGPDGEPRDQPYQPLSSWTVMLDGNGNGRADPGEAVATTRSDDPATPEDETGTFVFPNLSPGIHRVGQEMRGGFVRVEPLDPPYIPATLASGQVLRGLRLVVERAEIGGALFDDINRNGVRDAGETGLADWAVELDRGDNGSVDTATRTDAAGVFGFKGVGAGVFRVRAVAETPFVQTAPAAPGSHRVTVGDTGVRPEPVDFGYFHPPDLQIAAMPSQAAPLAETVQVTFTSRNEGLGKFGPEDEWAEELWLTDDGVLDGQGWELPVGTRTVRAPTAAAFPVRLPKLGVAPSIEAGGVVTVEMLRSGLFWNARLDPAARVIEVDDTNNTRKEPVRWLLPDLQIDAGVRFCFPGPCPDGGRVVEPRLSFDPDQRQLAVAGEVRYPVVTSGPIPETAGWWEQVWLGTDADVSAPNDPKRGVWHVRVGQILVSGIDGPRIANTVATERRMPVNLAPTRLPKEIDLSALQWIVLLDRPPGSTPQEADPGNLLETHEVAPLQAPPYNNVYLQPIQPTWVVSLNAKGELQNAPNNVPGAPAAPGGAANDPSLASPAFVALTAPRPEPTLPIEVVYFGGVNELSLSETGRFVAFSSDASNLVSGDTNLLSDIFVYDRDADGDGMFDEPGGTRVERVSVGPRGAPADGHSWRPVISADGRYVAFESDATNLVAGDSNANRTTGGGRDVFWHDRVSGRTVRVSVQTGGGEADRGGFKPSISGDGMVIAFESLATNLVRGLNPFADKPLEDPRYPWSGDNNGANDVFVHDIRSGVTTRVSVDAAGEEGRIFTPDPNVPVQYQYRPTGSAHEPVISADGRWVVFRSSVVHVPGPEFIRNTQVAGNGGFEILLKDMRSGQVIPVTQGNGPSYNPTISADAGWVAFQSLASDLVVDDRNGQGASTFVWNRATGQTLLASVDDQERQVSDTGLRVYGRPALSADGRLIAFLGAAEPDHRVWVRDLAAGQSWWVSAPAPGILAQSFANLLPTLSANGLWAGFTSADERIVDGINNERFNTFVRYVEPVELGEIRGMVYRDADRDGLRDPDESGLTGITVVLDRGADGVADMRVITRPNGFFTFPNIIEGRHRIRIEPDRTLLSTGPSAEVNEGWLELFLPGADVGRLEPQELGVAPKPDLTVRSLTLEPAELGGQAVVRYSVEDLRQGVITADDRWLEQVWLTDDGVVDGVGYERLLTDDALNRFGSVGDREQRVRLPRVSAVETGADIVSPQGVKQGLQFVVRVDPETPAGAGSSAGAGADRVEGVIDEADEGNNVRKGDAKWKLPDLVASLPVRIEGFGFDRTFDKPLVYRVANRGEAPLPEGSNWFVQLWLGTDEQVWLPDDPANGIWHRRIPTTTEQTLWFTGHGVQAPGSFADREIRIDLRGVQQPEGIAVASLNWIVLVDWGFASSGILVPVPADDPKADPGQVIEPHEADPARDITLRPPNAFAFPVSTIDIRPFRVETGLNTKLDWTGLALEGEGSFKLGLEPAPGEPFQPLLSLQGKLAVNTEKIEFEGEARFALFGGVDPLLSKGKWSLDVKKGLAKLAQTAADALFEFSGMKVKIDTLTFKNDPKDGGVIEIQGGLVFPRTLADLTLEVTDPHKIRAGARDMFIDGGKITLPDDTTLQLFGIDVFKAENLSLDYTHVDAENPANNRSFKIQGRVSLPFFYNLTADLCPAGGGDGACGASDDGDDEEPMEGEEPKGTDNFLRIRQDGIDLVGTISAEDLIVVPGAFAIKNVTVTVDTTKKAFAGEGLVLLPGGLGISGGLGFVGSDLNFIALGATNINKPIGATGAFLQLISGQLNHLAPGDPEPPEFKGSIGFTAGPQFTVPLPAFLGGKFEGSLANVVLTGILDPGKIRGEGELVIIGGLLTGKGSAELNWFEHALKVEGQLALPADIATFTSSLKADYRKYDFTYRTTTQVKIPKEIKLIGGLTLAESNLMVQYRNNALSTDDFVAMWRRVALGAVLGEVTLGLRINFDGSWELLGAERVAAITAASPAAAAMPTIIPPVPPTQQAQLATVSPAAASFQIPSGRDWVLFDASWDNAVQTPPALQIVDPSGRIYDTSRLSPQDPVQRVAELSGASRQVFVVQQPAAGVWSVRIANPSGLLNPQFDASLATLAPTLRLLGPQTDSQGARVDIDFTAADADSQATIDWFYDNDRSGYDGLPITQTSTEQDGPGRFTWFPANDQVASGDYYVYGVISDGRNAPVFSDYSIGRIRVVESGSPGAPQGLRAHWAGEDAVALEWTPVPEASAYVIRYTADAAGEFYEAQTVSRGASAGALVPGLSPGRAYRFTVQAVNAFDQLGPAAVPVVGVVGPAYDRSLTAGPEVFARPGSLYRAQLSLPAGASSQALQLPAGATFDPATSRIEWSVPADASGWLEFVVVATRTDGTTSLRRVSVLAQGDSNGRIDGQVFLDADGSRLFTAGESGVDGWQVQLLDARTGRTLASTAAGGVDRDGDGRILAGTESGWFQFAELVPGSYRVVVRMPTGWVLADGADSVAVRVPGGDIANLPLPVNPLPARISGRAFLDANGDRTQEADEAGLAGTRIYLDMNGNGARDRFATSWTRDEGGMVLPGRGTASSTIWIQGEPGRVANASVRLTLQHDYLADIEVALVSPSGARVPLFANLPVEGPGRFANAEFTDTAPVPPGDHATTFSGSYKPLLRLDTLRGESPNGAWSLEIDDRAAGDAGMLQDWTLILALEEPEMILGEATTNGAFAFDSLRAGNYRVVAIPPAGFAAVAVGGASTPAAHSLTLQAGQAANDVDFALQPSAVTQFLVGNGSPQRSIVQGLGFAVNTGFTAPSNVAALSLVERNSGRSVAMTAFDLSFDPATGTATWSGRRLGTAGLDEGHYRATLTLAKTAGGGSVQETFDFHVLHGDANGDTRVNDLDLFVVWQAIAKSSADAVRTADLNADGRADAADFDVIADNYLRSLPTPANTGPFVGPLVGPDSAYTEVGVVGTIEEDPIGRSAPRLPLAATPEDPRPEGPRSSERSHPAADSNPWRRMPGRHSQ